MSDATVPQAAAKPPTPAAQRPTPELRGFGAVVALFALVAVSTLLDLFFFTGYYASDDREYLYAGQALLNADVIADGESVGYLRLTMSSWIALLLKLGADIQLVAASFLVFHQLLNVAVFFIGRWIGGNSVGLLAAYLLGTAPLTVYFSTMILPDAMLSVLMLVAIALFQLAYTRSQSGAMRVVTLAASGLLIGLGYLTKESALILLPFCAVAWLIAEFRNLRPAALWAQRHDAVLRGVAFVAGFAAVFGIEFAFYWYMSGEPVFRLGWAVTELDPGTKAHLARYGFDPLERWQHISRFLLETNMVPLWLGCFLAGGFVLYPIIVRRYWILYAAPLWIFLYQTWGSLQLRAYVPPSIKDRYYIPVLAFAVVIAIAALWKIVSIIYARIGPRAARFTFAAIVVAPLLVLPFRYFGNLNRDAGTYSRADRVGPAVEMVTRALESTDGPIIVSGTVARLMFPWQEKTGVRRFEFTNHPRIIKSIDVNPDRLQRLTTAGPIPFVEMDEKYLARRESFFRPSTLDQQIRHARLPELGALLKPRIPIPQPNADAGTIPGIIAPQTQPATQPGDQAATQSTEAEQLSIDFSVSESIDAEGYQAGVPLTSREMPNIDLMGYFEPESNTPRYFKYGDRSFVATFGARANQPFDRLTRLTAVLLRSPHATPSNNHGSSARMFWLDRIRPIPDDSRTDEPVLTDLTPNYDTWGFARLDGEEVERVEREDGRIEAILNVPERDYGWLLPKKRTLARKFFIPPDTRAVIELSADVEDDAVVFFIFDIGTAGAGDEAEVRDSKRHRVTQKTMHFYALGGQNGITIDPCFRVQGKGRFIIRDFKITLHPM